MADFLTLGKILEQQTEEKLPGEAVYVDQWQAWVTVRELTGKERGEYLGQCMDKEGNVNFKKLNPYMVVLATRYPDPNFPPSEEHPHHKEFPGLKDEKGDYITDPHPQRGESIFKIGHMGVLNQGSGAALEQLAQVAGRLSLLRPEDVTKKKKTSEPEEWENADSTTE